ncbi:MAG: hypothetical protein RSE41_04435 [Clostridia bacterium]
MNNLVCILALMLILISLIIIFSARKIVKSRDIECNENKVVFFLKATSTIIIIISLITIYYFR